MDSSGNFCCTLQPRVKPFGVTHQRRSELNVTSRNSLERGGMDVWANFDATGTPIPLIAGDADSRLAVMCDMHRDEQSPAWEILEQQLRLARAGWKTTRIPHRTLSRDPAAVIEYVFDRLHDPLV